MSELAGVPWYFFAVGGVAFVLTVAGMGAWMFIQSRLEAEEESTRAAGKGMGPVQHPEPLHAWIKMACAHLDQGSSWVDEPIAKAQTMLRNDWQIVGGPLLDQCLGQLANAPSSAWNDLRLIRVALAGYRSGYIDVAKTWAGVRPIAQRLQQRYPSFDAIWMDYLVGYRQWRRLPLDGSADDPETLARLQTIAAWRARPPLVDYRAPL